MKNFSVLVYALCFAALPAFAGDCCGDNPGDNASERTPPAETHGVTYNKGPNASSDNPLKPIMKIFKHKDREAEQKTDEKSSDKK